ncbi:MAG: hypothetical protein L3J05_10650, partial [Robiginitomaculum sp.]|nr:hypothetical protein [Robiginitomaculum sp.]
MILRPLFVASLCVAMAISVLPVTASAQEALSKTTVQTRPHDFVALSKRLSPAVVNISTAQTIEIDKGNRAFPKGSPLETFNDFFVDSGDQNRLARSLGS